MSQGGAVCPLPCRVRTLTCNRTEDVGSCGVGGGGRIPVRRECVRLGVPNQTFRVHFFPLLSTNLVLVVPTTGRVSAAVNSGKHVLNPRNRPPPTTATRC